MAFRVRNFHRPLYWASLAASIIVMGAVTVSSLAMRRAGDAPTLVQRIHHLLESTKFQNRDEIAKILGGRLEPVGTNWRVVAPHVDGSHSWYEVRGIFASLSLSVIDECISPSALAREFGPSYEWDTGGMPLPLRGNHEISTSAIITRKSQRSPSWSSAIFDHNECLIYVSITKI